MAQAVDTLQPVTIIADRGVVVSRTDTVSVNPLLDAAGVLQLVPALYVGDYGFGAGLKSVSLRGFGSAHTAIYLDGIRVGNVQSGQNDLGMIGVENLSSAVVDYAQNSISFYTAKPHFNCGRPVAGTVRLNGGSFGTWQPYARVDFRLNDRISLSTNIARYSSKGNFPLPDGKFRDNNDIDQQHGGADAWGIIDSGDWHAKIYFNTADRGTPGSLSWPSTDRQSDKNYIAQGSFRKGLTDAYELRISAKASYDDLYYQSTWGDSRYKQTEFQLNTVQTYRLAQNLTASLAADAQIDGLKGNVYEKTRIGTIAAASAAYRSERMKADLAVEYSGTFENGGGSWNSFSPSADWRLKVIDGLDITAFARRAYRVPVFNELYYPGYGNEDLKPEDAWLTDLGVDFKRSFGAWTLKASADGYYNYLTNKIISAPSEADPSVWLPYNVGKVEATGADLSVGIDWTSNDWKVASGIRYGWQQALDKTPDSYTFDQQIPYVARHALVFTADASWKGWALGALFNLRGGRRDGTGEMPAWNTLDLQAGKDFSLGKGMSLGARLSVRNMLNCRYDVIRDYPMPGRSLSGGIEFKF